MSDEWVELPKGAFTVKGLVKASGATSSYISRLCREGRLDALKVQGVWLIQPESAERWLRSDRKRGPKPKGTTSERGQQLEMDLNGE